MVQLIKKLSYKFPSSGDDPAMNELIAIIRAEQDKCLARIFPLSYKIFFRTGLKLENKS